MTFERIVCGVDGSPAGFDALRQAATMRVPDGRLLAAIVCEVYLAARTGLEAARLMGTLRAEAKETREAALREVGELPFADARIVEGRPIPSLLAITGREEASLLVVGTHGGSRAAGILLGSVATAMLHEAPCPVLVARPARDDPWFPRSIVVGVDGSPQSLQAAETATALAERFGADLRLLAAEGGQPLEIEGLRHIDELEWDRRQPVSALVAASKKADLVIVGGRGLSGVRALGSVSERVGHRAHCSVLVVRPVTREANSA
jgi:nucleotide-binding universal stress UspA family protein